MGTPCRAACRWSSGSCSRKGSATAPRKTWPGRPVNLARRQAPSAQCQHRHCRVFAVCPKKCPNFVVGSAVRRNLSCFAARARFSAGHIPCSLGVRFLVFPEIIAKGSSGNIASLIALQNLCEPTRELAQPNLHQPTCARRHPNFHEPTSTRKFVRDMRKQK